MSDSGETEHQNLVNALSPFLSSINGSLQNLVSEISKVNSGIGLLAETVKDAQRETTLNEIRNSIGAVASGVDTIVHRHETMQNQLQQLQEGQIVMRDQLQQLRHEGIQSVLRKLDVQDAKGDQRWHDGIGVQIIAIGVAVAFTFLITVLSLSLTDVYYLTRAYYLAAVGMTIFLVVLACIIACLFHKTGHRAAKPEQK